MRSWGSVLLAIGLVIAGVFQRTVEGLQTELLVLGLLLAPALARPWLLAQAPPRTLSLAQLFGLVALLGVRGRGAEAWAIHLGAVGGVIAALTPSQGLRAVALLRWLARLAVVAELLSLSFCVEDNMFAAARLLCFAPLLLETALRARESDTDHWRRLTLCLVFLGLDWLIWAREWVGGLAFLLGCLTGLQSALGLVRLRVGEKRFRRFAFALAAVGGVLGSSWLVGELCFRLVPNHYTNVNLPDVPSFFHVPGETMTYRGSMYGQRVGYENVVRWNSIGFWDVDHEPGVAPLTSRVLVVGDSFVEGVQVEFEQLLHRRLERGLTQQTGRPHEAISYGYSGWGQVFSYKALTVGTAAIPQFKGPYPPGFDFHPDLVVLEFLPGNDVYDNLPALSELTSRQIWASSFARRWYPLALEKGLYFTAMLLDKTDLILRMLKGEQSSIVMEVYDERPTRHAELWKRAWERTELAFGDIAAACRERGARLLVVVFPGQAEVVGLPGRDLSYPARRVVEICAERGIECLDMTPAFKAHPNPPDLFVALDGHWSGAGHGLAAEQILRYLAEHPGHR